MSASSSSWSALDSVLTVVPSSVWLAVGFTALLLVVYHVLTGPFVKPQKQLFDNLSEQFTKTRKSAFPPPYPNGWWKLCELSDLANKRIQSVSALGKDFVIFQNAVTKEVSVLDAFCPHLGAHLGDGKITKDGQRLQCPFHSWEFDTSGNCQHIPYCTANPASPGTPPANVVSAKRYTHRIQWNGVYVWFHCDNEAPTYELDSKLDYLTNEYKCYGTIRSEFTMHVSEMCENSADYYHFDTLHAPMPLPILNRFVQIRYDTKLRFPEDESQKHTCFFDNWGEMWLFNSIRLTFTRQKTDVTFEGPSVVHFDIATPLGTVHLVKSLLPVEPFRLICDDTWFAEPRTPRWLVKIVALIAKGGLEQDRTVWQGRRFNRKPGLVKGDGPFLAHRRFWRQFYSENSMKYAYQQDAIMDW